MLVGCDPKADSTALLRGGAKIETVLSLLRTKHKSELRLDDMVVEGKGGVLCVEAGGPRPGVGCAAAASSPPSRPSGPRTPSTSFVPTS